MVTREQFLGHGKKRRFELLPIPGLGDVRIRSLKESERSKFERDYQVTDDPQRQTEGKRALIAMCLCSLGEEEPMLTLADVAELADNDSAFTGYVFDACWKHCGFSKRDIESVLGNLTTIPEESSR